MSTQIADIIEPAVFLGYEAENSTKLNTLVATGVLQRVEALDAFASAGGSLIEIPGWSDLGDTEANIGSDDPATKAGAEGINSYKLSARIAMLNKWFSNTKLATLLAGSNPNQRVFERFTTYWDGQKQARILATLEGVIADNVANNGGDMVVNISTEDADNSTAANIFNGKAFNRAKQTMGDAKSKLKVVYMHSEVETQALNNDEIDFLPDSEGNDTIPTYKGARVVVDDDMPEVAGSLSGFKYTTYLLGDGAFGFGEGGADGADANTPIMTEPQELEGNGAGVQYIGQRKNWIIHPNGYSVGTAPAGNAYTMAELKLATTWNRVYDRKHVPIAALISNVEPV